MANKLNGLFEFDGFQLDVGERRLARHGDPVQLPPKVFDLLVLLIQNRGHLLEKDVLLRTLWPDSFVEESNLSVNISALRRILGGGTGAPNYIETVPKRGYRFTAPVQEIGAEVAPPSGGSITIVTVDEPKTIPMRSSQNRVRFWILGGCVLLALAFGLVWAVRARKSALGGIRSLAVLPFNTLGEDPSQRYLGLGMADAVITRLTSLRKLEIRSTSSVLKYSGLDKEALAAGNELHVDAVVDGRVQQIEKRIRLTVQLLRVHDGKQLWAETFDDQFTNIFAVQDAISERVASALSMTWGESDQRAATRRNTRSAEAYRLYMQGQYLASKRLPQTTLGAIEYYQKAIAVDPDYALAYAALADSYLARAGEGFDRASSEEAKTAALKSISIDGGLPEAHLALGQVLMRSEWDWNGAERAFGQAIAGNPQNADAHAAMATLYTARGQHDAAIREMELACRLQPMSAGLQSDLAWTLHFARRYSEAVKQAEKSVELDPWSYTAHRQLAKALLFSSRFAEGVAEAKKTTEIHPGRRRVLAELATAYVASGLRAQAEATLATLREPSWKDPEPHYEMAVLYAALGEKDSAFRSLATACDTRRIRVIWAKTDPELDPLRPDPRFQSILAKLHLDR